MSFSVTVQPSGRHFTAQADETLLSAGLRQGIGLPYGCKDGPCGSCKGRQSSGEVVMSGCRGKARSDTAEDQG